LSPSRPCPGMQSMIREIETIQNHIKTGAKGGSAAPGALVMAETRRPAQTGEIAASDAWRFLCSEAAR
ncbi:MAG TPA: hypothetical protein VFF06_14105, partial [Polyangia bacterium]|nr:hypothetical protein [Polyangia bacterium]